MISGTFQFSDGRPAVAVKVSLYTAKPDRTTDRFLRPAFTGSDGRFVFDGLDADCYVIEADAPLGASYRNGSDLFQQHSCVDPDQTDDSISVTLLVSESDQPFQLNLLHLADHHSRFEPIPATIEIDGESSASERGGIARVATKISELRADLSPEPTLSIHSGGALQANPYLSVFGGAADATLLNTVCFDLFAVGPQDLDLGEQTVQTFLDFLAAASCQTEVLLPGQGPEVSLTRQQSTDSPALEVRAFGDHNVGFVTLDLPPLGPAGERFDPETVSDDDRLSVLAETAQIRIDRLRNAGVENIIVVSEVGLDNDLALAKRLTGIDAVIGGGSHTLLGDFPGHGLEGAAEYPVEATNADGHPVCIGHAWHAGQVVGEMNLTFDQDGILVACGGTAHLLAGDGPDAVDPDPDAATAVRAYELALESLAAESIGDSRERFCLTGVPGRTVGILCGPDVSSDSNIRPSDVQRLVADSIRSRIGAADIAIINSGATAGGLPAGAITIEGSYRLLPHGHRLAVLEMTGAEVVATLEEAIERAVGPDRAIASYPHAMGLRWQTVLEAEAGSRTAEVEVRPPIDQRWDPIDLDASYVVATIDVLAAGGHGYETMAVVSSDGRAVITGTDYAQAFIDYVVEDLVGVVSPFRSDHLN